MFLKYIVAFFQVLIIPAKSAALVSNVTRSHCMFVLALKQPEVSKPSLQSDSALDTDDGITQVSAHLINSTISHL